MMGWLFLFAAVGYYFSVPAEPPPRDALEAMMPEVAPPLDVDPDDLETFLHSEILPCWNRGGLSAEARQVTVTVAFALGQDGRPVAETIQLQSADGGGFPAAQQAFEAARRAILRCGVDGFDLPPAAYAHWESVRVTFQPIPR